MTVDWPKLLAKQNRYCGSKHPHAPHEWASHLVGAPPEGCPRVCKGRHHGNCEPQDCDPRCPQYKQEADR